MTTLRLNRPFSQGGDTDEVMSCEVCGVLPGQATCQPLQVGDRARAGQGAGRPRVLAEGPPVVFEVEVQVLRPTVGVLAGLGSAVRALAPPELLELMVEVADELLDAYPEVVSRRRRPG